MAEVHSLFSQDDVDGSYYPEQLDGNGRHGVNSQQQHLQRRRHQQSRGRSRQSNGRRTQQDDISFYDLLQYHSGGNEDDQSRESQLEEEGRRASSQELFHRPATRQWDPDDINGEGSGSLGHPQK